MRKKLIIAVLAIVCAIGATIGILTFVLQKKGDITIAVAGYSAENPPEVSMGEFPYGDYAVTVTRGEGKTEQIPLTEEMISESDRLKLYREGEQTLTVSYEGATCRITVIVRRKSLDYLTLTSRTVTYTGQPFVVEVEGNVPADASVRYPNGNSFVNAGEYDVTAVVYGDVYGTKTLTAHLSIRKAEYDMSGVTFSDGSFVYDGREKSIDVKGELPEGVKVSYTIGAKAGNSAVDAGTYRVTARFSFSNGNYLPIDDKSADLTIEKAVYDTTNLKLEDKTAVYEGLEHVLTLTDESAVPQGVAAQYTVRKIKTGGGESVNGAWSAGHGAVDAGTYEVKVEFVLSDAKNYATIDPMTARLTIGQAQYDLSGVYMDTVYAKYDGEVHSLSIHGETTAEEAALPADVTVRYTIRKIYDADGAPIEEEAIEGNGATAAGEYEVTAYFSHDNDNYEPVESLSARLIIELPQEAQNA